MSKNNKRFNFECICFDTGNRCVFGDDVSRLSSVLIAHKLLFPNLVEKRDNQENMTIIDQQDNTTVSISKINGLSNLDYTSVFYIKTEISDTDEKKSDNFRFLLVEYLVKQGFGKIYITRDDFSSNLLNRLYLKINKVENLLRSYIVKHFSINEGVGSWFKQVLDGDRAIQKIDNRKYDEDVFSTLVRDRKNEPQKDENGELIVDTRIYLSDFGDIGNVIYANSFGNLSSSDLIEKIRKSNNIEDLQSKVQNNIDRYFGNFRDVGFQEKWEFLKRIRHKIAHNSLISLSQFEESNKHIDELVEFLEIKDEEKIGIKAFEEDEYIEIDKREYTYPSLQYKILTKNEMLKEIADYEKWSNEIGRDFMGLKNFLHNRLGGRGYHIGKSWDMLEDLEKEGYIDVYIWTDPKNEFPDQKAIKMLKNTVYSI